MTGVIDVTFMAGGARPSTEGQHHVHEGDPEARHPSRCADRHPNIQVQKSSLPDEAEAGEGRAKRCWRASGGQLPAACDQRRLNQTRWPSI